MPALVTVVTNEHESSNKNFKKLTAWWKMRIWFCLVYPALFLFRAVDKAGFYELLIAH